MPVDATATADIDRIVGRRVRSLRMGRGLAQHQLASKLGVSFQQLQKYESGSNRIAASKLWILSKLLSVDISEFFGDLKSEQSAKGEIYADALEAAVMLSSISDETVRASLMALIRDCAKKSQ